uniref:THO complex subunit 5B n=1 Tax=Oryza brachyantha TaxID=4533 RepID=J3LHF5_ORYBR
MAAGPGGGMDVEAPARPPTTTATGAASASKARSPHDVLAETRASVEEVAARILAIKKDGAPKTELRELVAQMSLLLITLRQANREILMEEDRVKGETEAAKAPVDSTTLQLHNLLYEKNHYVKAIRACLDFQTKYPGIELVPEEEFHRAAPADIRDKTLAADASHDLMLKRLNFELVQRKELCKLHEKLEQRKSSLLDTIANQKRFLSSLPSHLKSLKKASLPVQQQLGMQHTKKLKQHYAAELLPTPLYIIYTQLLGQKEAFGENIEVEITGSTKDAQTFAQQQAKQENAGTLSNGDNRVDDEIIDDEEDAQRRRSRSRKNVVKEASNSVASYQLHPLKVILHVFDTEDSGAKRRKLMVLRFDYLAKLNIVCVGIEDSKGLDHDILCNLFPDDTGLELPHQMAKLYAGEVPNFSEKDSRPYKWAQHLAGIDFLPEVPLSVGDDHNRASRNADLSSGLALYRQQNRAQTILQRIRSRKVAQMALTGQLDYLTKLKWPQIEHENAPWASRTPLCSLHSWSFTGIFPEPAPRSPLMVGAAGSADSDMERRSVTHWEETENTREDGELLAVAPAENTPNTSKMSHSEVSPEVRNHSRGLSLISKSATPSKLSVSHSFGRNEDDLDLLMYSDSELEEQTFADQEIEKVNLATDKSWDEYASREFTMVLSKTLNNGPKVMLEAKIMVSMEYPVRPPFFRLQLLSGKTEALKWHNDLRAMEAEVNLHILQVVPLSYEDYILTHQILCLAMLFDMHFDEDHGKRKVTSVIDVGLCKPVSGTMLTRSVRGRDRRQTIYWRGTDCSSSCL